MYLDAKISCLSKQNVCKIPRRSVFSENKVFIVNRDNKLEIMNINIISITGNSIVVDNIADNTMLVIEPLINAKEGLLVNPIIK